MGSVRDLKKGKQIKNNIKHCHSHRYTPVEIKQAQLIVNQHKAYLVFGN